MLPLLEMPPVPPHSFPLRTASGPRADMIRGFARSTAEATMSQTPNRLLDELAKLMTNAAGAAQGLRQEFDTMVRSQAERFLNDLDIVKREEFDAVRDMAAKAREENDRLARRIAELESEVAGLRAGRRTTRTAGSTQKAASSMTATKSSGGARTTRSSATTTRRASRKPSSE